MVDSVTQATLSSSAGASAMKQATGFNKDDFLTLFITQMKNQDPLSPMDSTEFLGQLAQLTQVEQAYNTNSNLKSLMDQQNASNSFTAVSFIGREIEAQSSSFSYSGSGGATLQYSMPSAVSDAKLEIADSAGTIIRSVSLGKLSSGEGSLSWDGKSSSGTPAVGGTYQFSIKGAGSDGNSVAGIPIISGAVDSVSLEGSSPFLTVAGISIPISDVRSVRK